VRGASFMLLAALAVLAQGCRRSTMQPGVGGDAHAHDAGSGPGATLLGGERGLDHVGVAVKDLDLATHTYHDLLGFSRPIAGKLPNGIQNVNYYFADSTYLETMIYWDRTKADWLAAFTDNHSGALFAVLSAFSPEATTEFLSARGIKVSAPYSGTIQTAGEDAMPEEKWRTFFLPAGVLPGNAASLYFIAYKRGPRDEFLQKLEDPKLRRRLFHKNTALGLRAVWFAVPDLAVAAAGYEKLGLPRGRAFKDQELGADGQVFVAGAGDIRLLAPTVDDGAVARFLRERGGPGIMGVTLSAGNVQTAATVIAEGLGVPMPTYQGLLGASIRVSPDRTLGVWLEFTQK
jgi:hypothetical protein